jgi:hypothetical protein
MSKNGSKGRKNRARAEAAALVLLPEAASALLKQLEAEHGPIELNCACGWELPEFIGLRFDDPSNKPASVRGFVIGVECPVCGRVLEERLFDPGRQP